jgi:hypothetical protein
MNGKQLVRKNRGEYLSLDGSYRIQYFSIRGGESAWVISTCRANGFYFAIDHAPTFEAARIKYLGKVAA